MQATTIRRSVIRLVGIVAIMLSLILTSGLAAAAPITEGPFECGSGECPSASLAAATRTVPQLTGGPDGARILE